MFSSIFVVYFVITLSVTPNRKVLNAFPYTIVKAK